MMFEIKKTDDGGLKILSRNLIALFPTSFGYLLTKALSKNRVKAVELYGKTTALRFKILYKTVDLINLLKIGGYMIQRFGVFDILKIKKENNKIIVLLRSNLHIFFEEDIADELLNFYKDVIGKIAKEAADVHVYISRKMHSSIFEVVFEKR